MSDVHPFDCECVGCVHWQRRGVLRGSACRCPDCARLPFAVMPMDAPVPPGKKMNDVTALLPPEVRDAYRHDAGRRMWDAPKSLPPLDVSLRRLVNARPVNGPPAIPGKKAP